MLPTALGRGVAVALAQRADRNAHLQRGEREEPRLLESLVEHRRRPQHVRATEDTPHRQVVRLGPLLVAVAPVARGALCEAAERRLARLREEEDAVRVRGHALDAVEARRARREGPPLLLVLRELERGREGVRPAVLEAVQHVARADLRLQLVARVQRPPRLRRRLVRHLTPVARRGAQLGVVAELGRAEPVVEVATQHDVVEARAGVRAVAAQVELLEDTRAVAVPLEHLPSLALVRGEVRGDEAEGRAAQVEGDRHAALALREHLGRRVAHRAIGGAEGGHLGDCNLGHVVRVRGTDEDV
eukprot:scaffold57710_cov62-Phaeocystis_antarctica.AAC.4